MLCQIATDSSHPIGRWKCSGGLLATSMWWCGDAASETADKSLPETLSMHKLASSLTDEEVNWFRRYLDYGRSQFQVMILKRVEMRLSPMETTSNQQLSIKQLNDGGCGRSGGHPSVGIWWWMGRPCRQWLWSLDRDGFCSGSWYGWWPAIIWCRRRPRARTAPSRSKSWPCSIRPTWKWWHGSCTKRWPPSTRRTVATRRSGVMSPPICQRLATHR